ncbi:hypothetical protein RUND412_005045 [Rhizina undulata]
MAQVTFNSEFMKQIIPAVPIPKTAHFQVVHDEEFRPMIFSIGSDGVFYLIKSDSTGKNQLINLSAKFKLSGKRRESSGGSIVHVMEPIKPSQVDWAGNADLRPQLFQGIKKDIIVKRFYLGNNDDGQSYPLLIVVFSNAGNSNVDVNRIHVDVTAKSWSYKTDIQLPENTAAMTDMCIGNLSMARGVFTLYEIQGTYSLKFVGLIDEEFGVSFSTDLIVPPGAKTLASFTNNEGYTDLLIGGTGLFFFTAEDASNSGSNPTQVTSDNSFHRIQEIYVAKADDRISVWATNGDNTMTNATAPVPIMTQPQGGGRFAALLNPISNSQQFFVTSDRNQLSSFKQSGDTRLWKQTDLVVPSISNNIEFASYSSHIHLKGANGEILRQTKNVGPDGVPVTTDSLGNITIILEVSDISAHVFTLKDAADNSVLGGHEYIVDPAEKVKNALAKIKTSDDLRDATLRNGRKLLESSNASPNDISNAAKAISLLNGYVSKLESDGKKRNHCTAFSVASCVPSNFSSPSPQSIVPESVVWDAWHWVEEKFDSVKNWFIEAAFAWIMKVLRIAIDNFIEWVAGADNVDSLAPVDKWFANLADKVRYVEKEFPDGLEGVKGSEKQISDEAGTDLHKARQAANTPGANWSNYQLEHGGINFSAAQTNDHAESEQSRNAFSQAWREVVEPALNSIMHSAETIGKDFAELFNANSELSTQEIFKWLGSNIRLAFIDVLRKIAVGMIRLMADIIRDLQAFANQSINIPLLSALYKKISGGSDLSVLDSFALLIAIPSTVIYKVLTGKKPSDIGNLSWNSVVGGGDSQKGSGAIVLAALWTDGFTKNTTEVADETWLKKYSHFSGLVAFCTGLFSTTFGFVKWAVPDGALNAMMERWDFFITLIGLAFSYPVSSSPKPGMDLQIRSWIIGGVYSVLQKLVFPRFRVPKKFDGILGLIVCGIQFYLQVAISIEEFGATEITFPGKDTTAIILKLANSILTFIGKGGGSVAKIIGTNPAGLKAATIGVAFNYIAFGITIVRLVHDIDTGKYHWVVDFMGFI